MARSDLELQALADRWAKEHEAQTGRPVYFVRDGDFTYAYDIDGRRVVCAFGRSGGPDAVRDTGRQGGAPPVPKGDHKGHVFAHSMGGRLDINLFKQNAHMNLSREWRSIERVAANEPGMAVAIRMRYDDDSDRPARIDYAYEHPDRGSVVAEFDNRSGALIRERIDADDRELPSAGGELLPLRERGSDRSAPRVRSRER